MNKKFIQKAINLSRQKMNENVGGPFGCVVVKNGEIIAEGWNKVTSENDPTAHAEMTAIRNACDKLNSFDLKGCDLYIVDSVKLIVMKNIVFLSRFGF